MLHAARTRLLTGLILALAAAALSAGSGCAAVRATQQPEKKDMHVLNPGVSRTHVIAEFGTPTFSEERNGVMVDVFAFKQGYSKGTKALRAVGHGAADVMTFGLWEVVGIPIEGLADGTDVKVEVTYDQGRYVQSVTVLKGDEVVHPKPLFARKTKPMAPSVASSPAAPPPAATSSGKARLASAKQSLNATAD